MTELCRYLSRTELRRETTAAQTTVEAVVFFRPPVDRLVVSIVFSNDLLLTMTHRKPRDTVELLDLRDRTVSGDDLAVGSCCGP